MTLGPMSLCFFPASFAAGTRLCAAAPPCGGIWTLFLQLKGQFKRIHNALLH